MKKLMGIFMVLALVVPFFGVNAETTVYQTYNRGDEVNFYHYDGDKIGLSTVILEDMGANSEWVKALALGMSIEGQSSAYYFESTLDAGKDPEDYTELDAYKNSVMAWLQKDPFNKFTRKPTAEDPNTYYVKNIDEKGNLQYITLDEFVKTFNATKNADGTYSVDVTKYGETFKYNADALNVLQSKGFYTGTVDKTDNTVWVVEYTMSTADPATAEIAAITVKKVPMTTNQYSFVPVLYMNKTYDCKREVVKKYACYSCDGEYKWAAEGTQADSCTLVDTVNAKADCAKNPKTGMEDYILPVLAIVSVGMVAIVVASKKDLFRNI